MTGYAILIDLVTTNTIHYGTQQPVGYWEKQRGCGDGVWMWWGSVQLHSSIGLWGGGTPCVRLCLSFWAKHSAVSWWGHNPWFHQVILNIHGSLTLSSKEKQTMHLSHSCCVPCSTECVAGWWRECDGVCWHPQGKLTTHQWRTH